MPRISTFLYLISSIFLYLLSFTFPAFYIGDSREPQSAATLLLIGWLGPIDGHFSWYANLAYIFALIKYKKPKLFALLACIASVFALSFLLYKKIIVSEAPTYGEITAYGWGYYLWCTSITLLGFFSLFRVSFFEKKQIRTSTIFVCQTFFVIVPFALFVQHHYLGENSQNEFEKQRSSVFRDKCKIAGEILYKKPKLVHGVFFDPGRNISFQQVQSTNRWYIYVMGGDTDDGLLNSGLIKFYETRNKQPKKTNNSNYLRYEKVNGNAIKTDKLESEYAIITHDFIIPEKFKVIGGEVIIIDLEDNSILAKTTYVFSKADELFCGHSVNGYFGTGLFYMRALNLKQRYPSVFNRTK